MDFIFQGFQSPLPFWSYLLIFICTSYLSWWSYKSIQGIGKFSRYSLIMLRSSVFFVLLLILTNPLFETKSSYFEQSTLSVMLDNSASTAVEKNLYDGINSYRQVLDALGLDNTDQVNVEYFSIGSDTRPTALDSLSFDADQTNLSSALGTIREHQSQTDAAILISDGIYTRGQNPVFTTENISIPVFTIGLGDTTAQQDLMVRSVSTNSTGYLNTNQPVTVTISNQGFGGQPFQVQLVDGQQIIESNTINTDANTTSRNVTFQLPLSEEGLQQFSIRIPPLENEWTTDNNEQRFSVNVKDAKQNILSLAFEIHPDIRFFRSLLLSDKNTNLIKRSWIKGNQFIEGSLDLSADSIDLAIIHGYPRGGLPSTVENRVQSIAESTPLLIHSTPLFSPQQFENAVTSLPVITSGKWQFNPVAIQVPKQFGSHPILELSEISFDIPPDISAPIQNIENGPAAQTILSSVYRGNPTGKPILSVQERGNRRISLISAYGWYKLAQDQNPEVRNFGRDLILNTVSWTASQPNDQLLEVNPIQTTFSGSESVILNGYLQNERGNQESEAAIDVTISSDSGQQKLYSMQHIKAGQYRLDVGSLPQGIYSFQAVAQKSGRELDSQSGEFAVSQSNAELLDTRRNTSILKQISERTGAKYFNFDDVSAFWQTLEDRDLLERKEKVESTYFYPYQNIGWFIMVILLLAAEWILRNYLSLP